MPETRRQTEEMSTVLIDCETCIAPAHACRDCVVTVLLDRAPVPLELTTAEEAAIGSLADAGLVPPLRLVSGSSRIRRDIA